MEISHCFYLFLSHFGLVALGAHYGSPVGLMSIAIYPVCSNERRNSVLQRFSVCVNDGLPSLEV
jgi:hypothetical protein